MLSMRILWKTSVLLVKFAKPFPTTRTCREHGVVVADAAATSQMICEVVAEVTGQTLPSTVTLTSAAVSERSDPDRVRRSPEERSWGATLAMVGGSELVSPTALAVVRGCFAALGLFTLWSSIADKEGVRYQLQRPAGSQLPVVQVHLTGLKRLTTFTVQSWTLLSLYFTGATVASAALACGAALPQLVQVGLWLSFETAWASALMTSSVTTCVCAPDPQGPLRLNFHPSPSDD